MEAIFLLIWFYVYAGLMFAMVSYSVGLFQRLHWAVQALLWPVLLTIQAVKRLRESEFGYFIRYCGVKLKTRCK